MKELNSGLLRKLPFSDELRLLWISATDQFVVVSGRSERLPTWLSLSDGCQGSMTPGLDDSTSAVPTAE